jgi:DNA-binding transcriptional LysR family regulator
MEAIAIVDDMLLAQLEAFVEAARRGNVSRAADALYLTQPALSARLKALEADLGTTLLVRTKRGVHLSEAGQAFLPFAQRALAAAGDGRQLLIELGRGGVGRLAIGAAPAVATSVLPRMLRQFRADHPKVQLVVRTGHSDQVLQMVLREEVDVGIVRELRNPDVVSVPLYEDELVLVVEPGHRFAEQGAIELAEISNEHLVLFDRTSSYHELTSTLFREAGVVPRGVMEVDAIDAAKKMVEHGLGVALLPYTAVVAELGDGRLARAHLADTRVIRRRIVAVRRRDAGEPSGLVAEFLALPIDLEESRAPAA